MVSSCVHPEGISSGTRNGCVTPEVLPVSQGHSAGAIHLHHVLVKLLALQDCPRAFPPPGMIAYQVLQEDFVTFLQSWKTFGFGGPLLLCGDMSLGHCLLSVVQKFSPGVVRIVLTLWDW